MAGDLEDLAANDTPRLLPVEGAATHGSGGGSGERGRALVPSGHGDHASPTHGGGSGGGGAVHGGPGGPVLVTSNPGSNMILSGPAIIQQPPSQPYMMWRPDAPCPTCGQALGGAHGHDKKDEAKPAWKLPEAWNVPPGLCAELKRLQDLAYTGDAPSITLGGCRSLLQVLFAQLPPEVTQPKMKEPEGFWRKLFGPAPEKPSRTPKAVLKRAREQGYITDALLSAGERLPLDPDDGEKSSTSTARQFVAFLIELADALYAQPSRLA